METVNLASGIIKDIPEFNFVEKMTMNAKIKVCQSCGMPLTDNNKGTNDDQSLNEDYCNYCYEEGEFLIPNLTLNIQMARLANMAIENLKMPETEARTMAEKVLPGLKRWKVR